MQPLRPQPTQGSVCAHVCVCVSVEGEMGETPTSVLNPRGRWRPFGKPRGGDWRAPVVTMIGSCCLCCCCCCHCHVIDCPIPNCSIPTTNPILCLPPPGGFLVLGPEGGLLVPGRELEHRHRLPSCSSGTQRCRSVPPHPPPAAGSPGVGQCAPLSSNWGLAAASSSGLLPLI
jgi:hypothetical protein